MEPITFTLEAELAGDGNGWTDLTEDMLLGEQMIWNGGVQSTSPTALLANPGTLSFTLDNGRTNAANKTIGLPDGISNIDTNPLFEADIAGYYFSATGGSGYGRYIGERYVGAACCKCVDSLTVNKYVSYDFTRGANDDITVSCRVKCKTGTVHYHLTLYDSTYTHSASGSSVEVGNAWTKLSLTVSDHVLDTWNAGGTSLVLLIYEEGSTEETWLLAAVVIETGSVAHDYSEARGIGLPGYYSPGHANCRAGFAKNIRLRLTIYCDAVVPGGSYCMGIWKMIKDPLPTAGIWGQAVTRVEAVDWLGEAKETPMSELAIQTGKRVNELLPYVLAVCPTQPDDTSYEGGDSVLATAFDKDDMSQENVYSILGKLVRSELGRIHMIGAGVLAFESRNSRAQDPTVDGIIDNAMETLEFRPDETAYDQVKVTINPRTVDSVAVQLAKLDEKIKLTPGESKTFILYYTDPVGGGRISGTDIVQPLVGGTHFKFGSTSGTSQDLNAYLSITLVVGGNCVTVTVENTGTKKGWINLFLILGKGIYTYDPYTATSGTGLRVLSLDMPYQSNPLVADAICAALYNYIHAAGYKGCKIDFNANKDSDLMILALQCGISSRLLISESLTALAGYWNLNGYQMTLGPGCKLDVSWWLQKQFTENIVDPEVSIDFNVITKTTFDGGGDVTWSHETVAGDALLVKISLRSADDPSGTTATYNGVSMTRVIEQKTTDGGGFYDYCAIFYLAAPATGAHDVYVNWPNSAFGGGVSYSLGNCTGYENAVSAYGNSAAPTIDVTSAPNDQVVDALASAAGASTNATVGAGQTRRENARVMKNGGTYYMITGSSTEPGQPGVTMSWNLPDARNWVMTGVSLIAGS